MQVRQWTLFEPYCIIVDHNSVIFKHLHRQGFGQIKPVLSREGRLLRAGSPHTFPAMHSGFDSLASTPPQLFGFLGIFFRRI